ncbi:hypothetical protein [Tumebacillus flagellatus]|uniref:Spore coat protein n=1 Tax=Tumebacillus flagellatus TaxID=1157490 RepID=A0A074LYP1_9BACL|nr:hypothetical protein [Tumebacillus flagellatus]KEO85133.1 hypothetical protein EL26_00820 [Tumebacillus flagellatus]
MSQNYWNPYAYRNDIDAEFAMTQEQTIVPQQWQLPLEPAHYPSYYEVPMPQQFPYPRSFRAKTNSGDEIEYELRFFPGPIIRPPFYGPFPVIRPLPPVPYGVPPFFW